MSDAPVERRARRLVRLYPSRWRERYGDEFTQLLIDDMRDRPHAPRRTADVIGHALRANLVAAGLAGDELAPRVQTWRALRVLGVMAAAFLALGIGLWSQLTVGWTWAAPMIPSDTRLVVGVMSGAVLGLTTIFGLAVILVVWRLVFDGRRRVVPLLVAVTSGVAFWIGCLHFAGRYPAAPGWAARSSFPIALARIGWAGTLWISAYWAHPTMLAALSEAVLAWMVVSPLLLAICVAAGLSAIKPVRLSTRSLRTLVGLAAAGVVLAAVFLAATAVWILFAAPGPRGVFEPGTVDDVGLAWLVAALFTAAHITRRGLVAIGRPRPG